MLLNTETGLYMQRREEDERKRYEGCGLIALFNFLISNPLSKVPYQTFVEYVASNTTPRYRKFRGKHMGVDGIQLHKLIEEVTGQECKTHFPPEHSKWPRKLLPIPRKKLSEVKNPILGAKTRMHNGKEMQHAYTILNGKLIDPNTGEIANPLKIDNLDYIMAFSEPFDPAKFYQHLFYY